MPNPTDDVVFGAPPPQAHDMSDVTFGAPPSTTPPPAQTPQGPERSVLENIAGGFMKGAAKTAEGAIELALKGYGKLHGVNYDPGKDVETERPSIARDVGEGAENIAEFATGDAALEGMAKFAKIAKNAPELIALAEKYPKTFKILSAATKGAAVGGAQGAVKGEPEGKAVEGAEGGALGGAAGGVLAETASEVSGALAKRFGIGTTAVEDATRGAKPGKRNYKFADDFKTAAPLMDAENQAAPAKSLEDWADHTAAARNKVWTQQVQPLVDRHATVPLSGIAIRDSIESQIPDALKKYDPEKAADVQRFANEFMPQQVFQLNVGDAEAALEHFNAKLSGTGYWSKMPSERAAMLKTDPEVIKWKAAGDAIRDELYNRLGILEPQSDMRELKQQYGALRNVENELRGQVNVQGRQSPISLKEAIGLVTGLGRGGLAGGAMAALPFVDRAVNAPEKLVGRAVQKVARPGEEGMVSKAAQAVGSAAKEVTSAVAAGIGRITFQASDGTVHSVPENQIHAAMQVDPHLVIINQ